MDILDEKRLSHSASKRLMAAAERGEIHSVITGLSVVNANYTMRRQSISHGECKAFIHMLLRLCEFAPTDGAQLQNAVDVSWLDLEDAVQYQAALSSGRIQAIITNDRSGFKASRIPVFTPDAFVAEHL